MFSSSSELGELFLFQFVDFVNFIGNFQSAITQPNLAQLIHRARVEWLTGQFGQWNNLRYQSVCKENRKTETNKFKTILHFNEVFEESLQGVSPTSLATDPQFYKRAMEMCILRDDRLLVHKYCAQHGIGVGTEKFYINFAEELREQDLSLGLLYHLAKEKYVQLC